MAIGIKTKIPVIIEVMGSVGTQSLDTDCIEVVLRNRSNNGVTIMLNLNDAQDPDGGGANAIRLAAGESIVLPAHGNDEVQYIKETGAVPNPKLEIIQILQA